MTEVRPSELIQWDFTVAREGQVSRYGHLGEIRYKQYLPGGIEFPISHPPRPIAERSYRLARSFADKQGS